MVGTTVHVMWITHDKDVWARYKIFYRRSTDNGQTWEPKQLIYTSESGLGYGCHLQTDGGDGRHRPHRF